MWGSGPQWCKLRPKQKRVKWYSMHRCDVVWVCNAGSRMQECALTITRVDTFLWGDPICFCVCGCIKPHLCHLWQLKGLPDCGQPVSGHRSTGKSVTTRSSEALLELAHRRSRGLITCNQFGPLWKASWTRYFMIFMCILFLSQVYQEFAVCKPSRLPNLPQPLIQVVQACRACDMWPRNVLQSFTVWA